MFAKYRQFWHVAPIATAVLTICIVLLLFFTIRLGVFFLRPMPPKDVVIEPWMTPRLISHSWHVPPDVLGAVLQIQQKPDKPHNIDWYAENLGMPVETLIDEIEAAIAEFRANQPNEGKDKR